jgi:hypothetical protein
VALRIHRVPAGRWARLAASRRNAAGLDGAEHWVIDLVALESETDPGRRMQAEVALIQASVNALSHQRV